MDEKICPNCGASEFIYYDKYKVCKYCDSKFEIKSEKSKSKISIQSDIDMLLEKCEKEPDNLKKYINLILDIDPTNREVMKYL